MSDLQSNDTNNRDFNENISSDSINPTGESEQSVADDVAQPELLQNCHANQNKFPDDIASKKAELNEALTNAGDDK